MLAQGTTKLAWLPTIASPNMVPTLAEITAGLATLGNFTSTDDFRLGAGNDDELAETLLAAAFTPSSPERANYEAALTVYRGGLDQPNVDGEKAWKQWAVAGVPGYLVVRVGPPGELGWAPGDVISVYQVVSGDGQALTPSGAHHRFRWPLHVQAVNERTTVNVLTFRALGYQVGATGEAITALSEGATVRAGTGTSTYQPFGPAGTGVHGEYAGRRYLEWDATTWPARVHLRGWLWLPVKPSSAESVYQLLDVGGASIAALRIGTAGSLNVEGAGGAAIGEISGNWTGQWIGILAEFDRAAGTQTVKVYRQDETLIGAITGGCGTNAWTLYREGCIVTTGTVTSGVWWSDTQVTDVNLGLVFPAPGPAFVQATSVALTSTTGRMRIKTARVTEVRVVTEGLAGGGETTWPGQVPDLNGYTSHDVTVGSYQTVAVRVEGRNGVGVWGTLYTTAQFTSLPTTAPYTVRIALASCNYNAWGGANNDLDDQTWVDMNKWLDGRGYLIHCGDFHYGESVAVTYPDHLAALELQTKLLPGLRNVLSRYPLWYTRSDHEAGDNNEDTYHKAHGLAFNEAYDRFVAHQAMPELLNGSMNQGFTIGRVRFTVMDFRTWHRDPMNGKADNDPTKTMLGATQKDWLVTEKNRAEPVKVLVFDPSWYGYDRGNKRDTSATYKVERDWIANLYAGQKVLMLGGDDHGYAADDGTNNAWGGWPYFGVSGTRARSPSGTPLPTYQQSRYLDEQIRAYGRMTLSETASTVTVALSGWDVQANVERVALTKTWNV